MGNFINSFWRIINYRPKINEKIVGIDFGTSDLCYVYGYLNEHKEKK